MKGLLKSLWCLVVILNVACANQIPKNADVSTPAADCEVVDHDGGTTQICGQPKNIIAIGPNMLELLLTLEVQPIGYADYYALPSHVFDQPQSQIPYMGKRIKKPLEKVGTWNNPSLETIVRLQPDLILGSAPVNQAQYSLLSQAAPTLLFTYGVQDEWQEQLRILAKVLGLAEKAEQVIAAHHQRLISSRERLQPYARQHPQVLLAASENLEQAIAIETSESRCGGLLKNLGFEVLSPDQIGTPEGRRSISLELLPELEADWIFFLAWNPSFQNSNTDLATQQIAAVQEEWQKNAIAQSLSASQENRVYFHSAYVCRAMPGPIGTEQLLNQLDADLQLSH